MSDKDRIARNLKAWRMEAGFTQELAAVWLAISMVQVQRIERGEANVRMPALVRMAKLYRHDWKDVAEEAPGKADFSGAPQSLVLVHPAVSRRGVVVRP